MKNVDADVLIVGAGLTGLMAANELQQRLLRVIVVDRAQQVGGRLATQRVGPGQADHGAQFITTGDSEFQRRVEAWLTEGIVYRWSTGWSDGSLLEVMPHSHFRYAAHGGMQALAEHLAQGVDTRLNTAVTALTPVEGGWQATNEHGLTYTSRALLLTPPAPESLALVDNSQVELSATDRAALERIDYSRALVGLFWVEGRARLPETGVVQRLEAPIGWLADNQRKGISAEATIITVQAGATFSHEQWAAADTDVLDTLQAELQPYLEPPARVIERQLKRWRYALPVTTHPEPYLRAAALPPLLFAGDAFGRPLIEGAALSGIAAAAELATSVTNDQ